MGQGLHQPYRQIPPDAAGPELFLNIEMLEKFLWGQVFRVRIPRSRFRVKISGFGFQGQDFRVRI